MATSLKDCLGDGITPFSGVTDGGEIASVKETAKSYLFYCMFLICYRELKCHIEDRRCICHQLNNIIKKMLCDYFLKSFIIPWRGFIKLIKKSDSFKKAWYALHL